MGSPLGPEERILLADALGDTLETVIPVFLLRHGLCEAWVAGIPSSFEAAIIQSTSPREEPWVFGLDVEALWRHLGDVAGWKHVNVAQSLARPLGAVVERETNAGVRYYGDIYHTLTRPAATFNDTAVRELTPKDLPTLKAAPAVLQGAGGCGRPGVSRSGARARTTSPPCASPRKLSSWRRRAGCASTPHRSFSQMLKYLLSDISPTRFLSGK